MKKWFVIRAPMQTLRSRVADSDFPMIVKNNGQYQPVVCHTVGLWERHQVPEVIMAVSLSADTVRHCVSTIGYELLSGMRPNLIAARLSGIIPYEGYMLALGSEADTACYLPLLSHFYRGKGFPVFQALYPNASGGHFGDENDPRTIDDWLAPRIFY